LLGLWDAYRAGTVLLPADFDLNSVGQSRETLGFPGGTFDRILNQFG
jgi:hypothetical protein